MSYPKATPEALDFFRQHGWIVVEWAIPQGDLDAIERGCERLIAEKERLAYDWAWDAKETKTQRSFRIVQGTPAKVWPEIADQAFR